MDVPTVEGALVASIPFDEVSTLEENVLVVTTGVNVSPEELVTEYDVTVEVCVNVVLDVPVSIDLYPAPETEVSAAGEDPKTDVVSNVTIVLVGTIVSKAVHLFTVHVVVVIKVEQGTVTMVKNVVVSSNWAVRNIAATPLLEVDIDPLSPEPDSIGDVSPDLDGVSTPVVEIGKVSVENEADSFPLELKRADEVPMIVYGLSVVSLPDMVDGTSLDVE